MSNTDTDYGTTYVVIGDDKYELKFNLKAVKAIDTHFNGLLNAVNAIGRLSPQSLGAVITFGAGLSTKKEVVEELEWAITRAGVSNVLLQVNPYLMAMLNPAQKTEEQIEKEAEAGNE